MAFELDLFALFSAFIFCGIEEIKGGYGVGVEPQYDGEGEFCEGYNKYDRVGDELDHIDFDPMALSEFVSCKFVTNLSLVEVGDPFDVVPKILRTLDDRIFRLLQDELGLQ